MYAPQHPVLPAPSRPNSHVARNILILVGAVLLTAVLSVGATLRLTTGHLPFIKTTVEVTGSITVPAAGVGAVSTCTAAEGYDDIRVGAQVKVAGAEHFVGVGDLDTGKLTNGSCQFPFDFEITPDGSRFYSLTVGNRNRGDMEYPLEQLKEPIRLSIGI